MTKVDKLSSCGGGWRVEVGVGVLASISCPLPLTFFTIESMVKKKKKTFKGLKGDCHRQKKKVFLWPRNMKAVNEN